MRPASINTPRWGYRYWCLVLDVVRATMKGAHIVLELYPDRVRVKCLRHARHYDIRDVVKGHAEESTQWQQAYDLVAAAEPVRDV